MTDLFIILLKNKDFKNDAFTLLSNIIHDYLKTSHLQNLFNVLIQEQVLQNPFIRENMYRLLKEYVETDNVENLTAMAEEILVMTINLNGVQNAVKETIVSEAQNAFESKAVYEAAMSTAMAYLGS